MKRRLLAGLILAMFGSVALLSNAWADGHDGRRGDWSHHRDDDGGHWQRGWHNGVFGWLWVVDSALLIYSATHPAPPPQPPVVIVRSPSAMAAPPAPGYWYFCASSGMYYPYVSTCPEAWQTVPATPPAPSPGS